MLDVLWIGHTTLSDSALRAGCCDCSCYRSLLVFNKACIGIRADDAQLSMEPMPDTPIEGNIIGQFFPLSICMSIDA
jgi:hypothetical protein